MNTIKLTFVFTLADELILTMAWFCRTFNLKCNDAVGENSLIIRYAINEKKIINVSI